MGMAGLLEELIEDILSRVPVKSLLRFKSASKNWYFLISQNHEFAKLQFQQSASKNIILHQLHGVDGANINPCSYNDVDSFESRKINLNFESCLCEIVGTANGLICVVPNALKKGLCYIWNPCTEEHITISLPIGVENGYSYNLFGFGYDSISDDYKIVGELDFSLQIFSLKTNSWKNLDYYFRRGSLTTALHSNGAFHWCDNRRQITAVDLATGEISYLDLPQEEVAKLEEEIPTEFVHPIKIPWVRFFIDYQGLLYAAGRESIWVMKEYENTQSWTKLNKTCLLKEEVRPFSISTLGELVFCTRNRLGVAKSDIHGRVSDDDKSRLVKFGFTFVFKESLISPRSFNTQKMIN